MKYLILLSFCFIFNMYSYAGPIKEGIVWEIEKMLLRVPSKIMLDKSKTKFLQHLHSEISEKDEMTILDTYNEASDIAGISDPLGLIAYIKEKDNEAIDKLNQKIDESKKSQETQNQKDDKAVKNTKSVPGDLQQHLDKIKEAREYGEQLMKED